MPEVFYLHLWGYGSSGSYSSHCRSSVASEWSEWFCHHVSHSQMDAGCIYLAAHPRQQVPSGKDGQEFHVLSPAYAISGSNGNATAPTSGQHVTHVAESGFNIKYGAFDIHLNHWSAVNEPSLTMTPGADINWVGH